MASLPRRLARLAGPALALAVVAGAPAVALGHGLSPIYQSPLPLAVYLVGAATTVALSFFFVLARDMQAPPTPERHIVAVPAPLRILLRVVGLAGWTWIMIQGIAGGSSDAAVATLFLWVYGWVGVAMLSAFVGPVWEWLDPFATIHDLLAALLRAAGIRGWAPSELPAAVRVWPAVAGFAFFIWLELAAVVSNLTLTVTLAGYTLLTLAMMAQFGRDPWRAHGETFTVWFRTLNRLAPTGIVPASGGNDLEPGGSAPTTDAAPAGLTSESDAIDARFVVRRPFASELLEARWSSARIVLLALGTGAILFDGLSQTVAYSSLFGAPGLIPRTLLLAAFLGSIAFAALAVARTVSPSAIGAGLLPIAVGYLTAHYLTYLLIDGQRILIAISDPLQRGDDLFGTAFYAVNATWLPPGLVWTVQLGAVVGGHMLGAWAGHVSASRDMERLASAPEARDLRHRRISGGRRMGARNIRLREVPLALVMVALTTLTLWSLGQAIVVEPAPEGATPAAVRPT